MWEHLLEWHRLQSSGKLAVALYMRRKEASKAREAGNQPGAQPATIPAYMRRWPETPATATLYLQIPSLDDLGEEPQISRLSVSILVSIIFLVLFLRH